MQSGLGRLALHQLGPAIAGALLVIVGERVNASGSKKMRELLNAEDWDGLVLLGKEQEREGAHILDGQQIVGISSRLDRFVDHDRGRHEVAGWHL